MTEARILDGFLRILKLCSIMGGERGVRQSKEGTCEPALQKQGGILQAHRCWGGEEIFRGW